MSDFAAVTTIFIAVGQWLVLLAWMMIKPIAKRQSAFAISTGFLAVIVLLLAPSGPARSSPTAVPVAKTGQCTLREGMSLPAVRDAMGDPIEIVDEQDTQGPGAHALVYPECVAHILNGRVRVVDYD